MKDVGWGRASAADIALVGPLHSAGFAVVSGAPYVARHGFLWKSCYNLSKIETNGTKLGIGG